LEDIMLAANANAIGIAEALDQVTAYWTPRVIGRVNDQYIKVAKLKGELAWHDHANEDEMFLVVYGHLRIQFKDREVRLGPGEFCVVPKKTMHNPVADEECGIVLIETVTTQHTGDLTLPQTVPIESQLV
jgi:mannose-6-phosphate isomerase-like protein (cupin superfamily)